MGFFDKEKNERLITAVNPGVKSRVPKVDMKGTNFNWWGYVDERIRKLFLKKKSKRGIIFNIAQKMLLKN